MPRPFLAQFFAPDSSKTTSSNAEKSAKRQRAAKQAMQYGPPGLAEQLNPFPKNSWTLERKQRQEMVRSRYFRDKKRMHHGKLRAEERMRKSLLRRQSKVENYYRLNEMKPVDPRYAKAARLARLRYGRHEREAQRQHRQQWQKQARELKYAKKKQYRDITESMKREHRQELGLPQSKQAPWNI